RSAMEAEGFSVATSGSAAAARIEFQAFHPDACLLDYHLPDGTALDLISDFKAMRPEVPLLVLTGDREINLAVATIKAGAEQFLTKPIELRALRSMVRRMIEAARTGRRDKAHHAIGEARPLNPFLGTSRAIRALEEDARRAAESDGTLLLLGETGAGKGVLARWIHQNSSRGREAFVDLNCAGLSREMLDAELFGFAKGAFTGAIQSKQGLFEVADRGTFFLDEIGDIEISLQPKILKVVEEKRFRRLGEVAERQVDTRLVAATHRDLARAAADQSFRADLYYRLNTFTLRLPPLRERSEDLTELVQAMLSKLERETGRGSRLSDEAMAAVRAYPWPGNLRELRNVLEGALIRSRKGLLSPEDLALPATAPSFPPSPGEPRRFSDFRGTLAELERDFITTVLEESDGLVERATERLGIPRSTLYQRLSLYGLRAADFRRSRPLP
ncbi:MAG: sigma-54 dependent transcriptional regulator, partial [Thermoanaerobaculia bacterium]